MKLGEKEIEELVVARFNGGNGGVTIGGTLYRLDRRDVPELRSAIQWVVDGLIEPVRRLVLPAEGESLEDATRRQIHHYASLHADAVCDRLKVDAEKQALQAQIVDQSSPSALAVENVHLASVVKTQQTELDDLRETLYQARRVMALDMDALCGSAHEIAPGIAADIAALRIERDNAVDDTEEAYERSAHLIAEQQERTRVAVAEIERLRGVLHAQGLSAGAAYCDRHERSWYVSIGLEMKDARCPWCQLEQREDEHAALMTLLAPLWSFARSVFEGATVVDRGAVIVERGEPRHATAPLFEVAPFADALQRLDAEAPGLAAALADPAITVPPALPLPPLSQEALRGLAVRVVRVQGKMNRQKLLLADAARLLERGATHVLTSAEIVESQCLDVDEEEMEREVELAREMRELAARCT